MINQKSQQQSDNLPLAADTSASTPRDESHESSQPSHLQRSHHKKKLTEQQFIVGKKE